MAEAVLVAGASGYLGTRLVAELRRREVAVRALVRSNADPAAAELAAAGADVVAADACQPGALVGICDGCFAVVSCMAADMAWSSGSPEMVDRDANIALFQEAVATATRVGGGSGGSGRGTGGGVRRFMLVATFEGQEAAAHVPLQRAKEAAVDFVKELAPEHGISFLILRPTAYFRDFTDFPWRRMLQSDWMLVPGGGWAQYNPIDGAELAAFMADCLLDGAGGKWDNQEIRIGGPQVLTFRETIYTAAGALGKRRGQVWLITLPVAALRAAAALAGLLGVLWQPAARLAGALRFLIYSSTHNAVGMRWGRRTVADHYRDLRRQLDQQRLAAQPRKAD